MDGIKGIRNVRFARTSTEGVRYLKKISSALTITKQTVDIGVKLAPALDGVLEFSVSQRRELRSVFESDLWRLMVGAWLDHLTIKYPEIIYRVVAWGNTIIEVSRTFPCSSPCT
jgi:hypothetical protein